MSSNQNGNDDAIFLIDIRPNLHRSTRYNYLIESISFEKVWDFGSSGGGLRIEPVG